MLDTDNVLKDHPAHTRLVSYQRLELHTCGLGTSWDCFRREGRARRMSIGRLDSTKDMKH